MTDIDELQEREAALVRELGATRLLIAIEKARPIQCSVCSIDGEFDYLTEISVEVASGEEGYQRVRMYRCEEHLDSVLDALYKMGFRTHQHGTTATLEDQACVGSEHPNLCKTPTGPEVLVGAERIYDDGES